MYAYQFKRFCSLGWDVAKVRERVSFASVRLRRIDLRLSDSGNYSDHIFGSRTHQSSLISHRTLSSQKRKHKYLFQYVPQNSRYRFRRWSKSLVGASQFRSWKSNNWAVECIGLDFSSSYGWWNYLCRKPNSRRELDNAKVHNSAQLLLPIADLFSRQQWYQPFVGRMASPELLTVPTANQKFLTTTKESWTTTRFL